MSKSKDGAKPLSDRELDKTSGGSLHSAEDAARRQAELMDAALEKVSGGAGGDPRQGIGSDILDPKRTKA